MNLNTAVLKKKKKMNMTLKNKNTLASRDRHRSWRSRLPKTWAASSPQGMVDGLWWDLYPNSLDIILRKKFQL